MKRVNAWVDAWEGSWDVDVMTARTLGAMRASGLVKLTRLPMQKLKTTIAMAAQQQWQPFQRSRASATGMWTEVTDFAVLWC